MTKRDRVALICAVSGAANLALVSLLGGLLLTAVLWLIGAATPGAVVLTWVGVGMVVMAYCQVSGARYWLKDGLQPHPGESPEKRRIRQDPLLWDKMWDMPTSPSVWARRGALWMVIGGLVVMATTAWGVGSVETWWSPVAAAVYYASVTAAGIIWCLRSRR